MRMPVNLRLLYQSSRGGGVRRRLLLPSERGRPVIVLSSPSLPPVEARERPACRQDTASLQETRISRRQGRVSLDPRVANIQNFAYCANLLTNRPLRR